MAHTPYLSEEFRKAAIQSATKQLESQEYDYFPEESLYEHMDENNNKLKDEIKLAISPLEKIANAAESEAQSAKMLADNAIMQAKSAKKQSLIATVISIFTIIMNAIINADKIKSFLSFLLSCLNCKLK